MAPALTVFPEFGEVAANLAAIADVLPGEDNRHRQALRDAAAALRCKPAGLDDAVRHTMMALFDLAGGGKLVDNPEAWLLSAVAVLIQHEKMRLAAAATSVASQRAVH